MSEYVPLPTQVLHILYEWTKLIWTSTFLQGLNSIPPITLIALLYNKHCIYVYTIYVYNCVYIYTYVLYIFKLVTFTPLFLTSNSQNSKWNNLPKVAVFQAPPWKGESPTPPGSALAFTTVMDQMKVQVWMPDLGVVGWCKPVLERNAFKGKKKIQVRETSRLVFDGIILHKWW